MKFVKVIFAVVAVTASLFMVGCASEAPTSEGAIVQTNAGVFMAPTEFSIIKDGELVALDCHGFFPFTCEGEGVKLTFNRVKNNNFSWAKVKADNGTEYSCGMTHLNPNCVIKN